MRGDLQRILLESIEYSTQISFTSIWQEGNNLLALVLGALGYLGGSKGGSTRRDAYQQAFSLGQLTTSLDGIIVLHIKYLVDILSRVGLGDKSGTDALNLMRTALSTIQYW